MTSRLALLVSLLVAASTPALAEGPLDLPADLAGYYRARGLTTVKASGDKRRISGSLIVSRADQVYELRFSFKTQVAGADGPVDADLIGTGQAATEGSQLVGTTETQIILAAIPGIDPQFAFIPGKLGPRIVSTFEMRATSEPEEFRSEIETVPAPGYEWAATRTTMQLTRISPEAPQDKRLPLPTTHND